MRALMAQTLAMTEERAIAALCARWASPKTVQEMAEFYGRLCGELTKDSDGGEGRGVQVIVVTTDGAHRLDPDAFRAAAAKRVPLEANGHA